MKKYEVLNKIGNVIRGAGVAMFLLSLCIDIDNSREGVFKIMLMCIIVSVLITGFGQLLVNFSYIEGLCASICIVVGALLYNILKKPMKAFKRCDNVHTSLGSYEDTFKGCIKLHTQYVESLYCSDNNYEEVAKHE